MTAAACGGSKREDYEDEDVDFYFEYMGMLASEVRFARVSCPSPESAQTYQTVTAPSATGGACYVCQ
jgi:glycine betaine/choline ABC-type transport system substrate-binding protein